MTLFFKFFLDLGAERDLCKCTGIHQKVIQTPCSQEARLKMYLSLNK